MARPPQQLKVGQTGYVLTGRTGGYPSREAAAAGLKPGEKQELLVAFLGGRYYLYVWGNGRRPRKKGLGPTKNLSFGRGGAPAKRAAKKRSAKRKPRKRAAKKRRRRSGGLFDLF